MADCTYCGEEATTVDHVPPQCHRSSIIEAGLEGRYPFFQVPACRECNSHLGAKGWTLAERRKLVKTYLRRKYSKFLKIPVWEESEILKLGESLQDYIHAGLQTQRWVRRRLAYLG